MANNYFQFRQFSVFQDRCAMKVGTDGTLLGAWAEVAAPGQRILDAGTGTGLIALMLAQRYPQARVTAIDIDEAAVSQAAENVRQSPFADRIEVVKGDIRSYDDDRPYDAIVSNPPYFEHALESPDQQRTTARHTSSLSYRELLASANRMLADNGRLSVIIPADSKSSFLSEASLTGFFLTRMVAVRTTQQKTPRRLLIEFRKSPVNQVIISEEVLEGSPGIRSDWYQSLTHEFYIK